LLLAGFCYLCYRRSQTYADHDKSK